MNRQLTRSAISTPGLGFYRAACSDGQSDCISLSCIHELYPTKKTCSQIDQEAFMVGQATSLKAFTYQANTQSDQTAVRQAP